MPEKNSKIDVRFTSAEKEHLSSMAQQVGISTGELIRRLTTGTELPAYGKREAIDKVYKVNADLARLGNLYKLSLNPLSQALNDERTNPDTFEHFIDEVRKGHRKIMSTLTTLQEKINHL